MSKMVKNKSNVREIEGIWGIFRDTSLGTIQKREDKMSGGEIGGKCCKDNCKRSSMNKKAQHAGWGSNEEGWNAGRGGQDPTLMMVGERMSQRGVAALRGERRGCAYIQETIAVVRIVILFDEQSVG